MKKILILIALLLAQDAFAADSKNLILGTDAMFYQGSINGGLTIDAWTFNNTTDSTEMMYEMPESATLTQLCLGYNSRSAGDPPAHTVSLQGINTATGRADGTIKSSSNATCTLDPPASGAWDGTAQCCTMTSSYAATRGERLAVVLTCASGCAAGNAGSWMYQQSGNGNSLSFPYSVTVDDGAAGVKRPRYPIVGLKSASRTYGNLLISQSLTTYNSDSSPDEKALKFTLSSSWCSTKKLRGVVLAGRVPITGTTASIKLYDTDGTTVLSTIAVNGDENAAVGASNDRKYLRRIFPDSITLNCGSTYRIGYLAGNTTSAISLPSYNYTSTADMADVAFASDWSYSERTDAGAWTDTTTRQPFMSLILEDWTVSGGGGLMTQKQLSGGTQ